MSYHYFKHDVLLVDKPGFGKGDCMFRTALYAIARDNIDHVSFIAYLIKKGKRSFSLFRI